MSTYRELCSLATDMNQPDLIYKFMHLANHNAIWNSKKGAAFGFGSIAKKAGQQLAPHLPVIIPKLYRYGRNEMEITVSCFSLNTEFVLIYRKGISSTRAQEFGNRCLPYGKLWLANSRKP